MSFFRLAISMRWSRALDSDTAYGNIYTVNFKGGAIRGQIRRADDDDKH